MSDDVMPYAGRPLRGEKVSIASPSLAPASVTLRDMADAGRDLIGSARAAVGSRSLRLAPGFALCGALALWAFPGVLVYRYQPEQMFDALVRASVKPSGSQLLTLATAVTYFVLTGLALGKVATLPRRRALRRLLGFAVAPLIALSLAVTLVTATPLLFGILLTCFPDLL